MKLAIYRCTKCRLKQEHWIENKDSFPGKIACRECSGHAKRYYPANNVAVHVIQGKTGNSKTGYTSNPGYFKKT